MVNIGCIAIPDGLIFFTVFPNSNHSQEALSQLCFFFSFNVIH